MHPNYLSQQFLTFMQKHGMKKMRFHDIKHSCASLLLANGIPLKQIPDWLGIQISVQQQTSTLIGIIHQNCLPHRLWLTECFCRTPKAFRANGVR